MEPILLHARGHRHTKIRISSLCFSTQLERTRRLHADRGRDRCRRRGPNAHTGYDLIPASQRRGATRRPSESRKLNSAGGRRCPALRATCWLETGEGRRQAQTDIVGANRHQGGPAPRFK